jgi:hypothetical protein
MEIVTLESKAFQEIKKHLEEINQKLNQMDSSSNSLSEKWLDNQDVCLALRISKRTLQNMRDRGILPYSQEPGSKKIFYRYEDVENYLEKHYKKSFNSN